MFKEFPEFPSIPKLTPAGKPKRTMTQIRAAAEAKRKEREQKQIARIEKYNAKAEARTRAKADREMRKATRLSKNFVGAVSIDIPRTELTDRLALIRGVAPIENTGVSPDAPCIDPLRARFLVNQDDAVSFFAENASRTTGRLRKDERFYEWTIYSDDGDDVEDRLIARIDGGDEICHTSTVECEEDDWWNDDDDVEEEPEDFDDDEGWAEVA